MGKYSRDYETSIIFEKYQEILRYRQMFQECPERETVVMAKNEIDVIDVAPIVALPIFAGFVFGVWTLTLNVFGGFDFMQILWSGSGVEVTPALLGTVASVAIIVGTNQLDGSDYEQYEFAVIVVVLALPVLHATFPLVGDFIAGSDIAAFMAWIGTAVGTAYISYVE